MKNYLVTIVFTLGTLCALNAQADVSVSEVVVESDGSKNCYTTTYSNGDKTTECIISTKKPTSKVKKIVRGLVGERTCFTTTFNDNTTVVECIGA